MTEHFLSPGGKETLQLDFFSEWWKEQHHEPDVASFK